MSKSYDYSKVYLSVDEATELVDSIAIVLVTAELDDENRRYLRRAQELANLVLADIASEEDEDERWNREIHT